MKLGRYGDRRTLHWAKDRANEELRTVDEKTDPLIERKKERWKNLEARTVAQLCDRYLENHAKVAKKTWKTDEARIKKYIKPKLGHLRIEEVTRARVGRFYREVGATTPVEANRLVALLSIMFNRAPDWGLSPEGTPNPAKMRKDSMYREERRDRPIRTDELPRLIKAIEAEQSVYVRGALLLLLMTGLRKGEVLKARWDDVDLGRGTLHLPETKAGKPRHVQLSSEAVELIRELPRMVGNPHLFPSPSKAGAPLYDIKKPWARVRKVAKCEDLRIHDIRHSVATWLADGGFPAQTIQAALGHKNIEQTMGYVHASDQAPREAVETIGERIARHRKSRRGSASLEGAAEP